MSSSGSDSQGQPNPYGPSFPTGRPAEWQPQSYAQPLFGATGSYLPGPDYSHWGMRVLASLIDGFLSIVSMLPLYAGVGWLLSGLSTTTNPDGTVESHLDDPSAGAFVLIAVGAVIGIAFNIWNTCFRQGRKGATLGKRAVGIKLVNEHTGQPIGAGMSFVRQIAHTVDGFCYIGYLWPLWDPKRQTFADKILGTIVINQKTAP